MRLHELLQEALQYQTEDRFPDCSNRKSTPELANTLNILHFNMSNPQIPRPCVTALSPVG